MLYAQHQQKGSMPLARAHQHMAINRTRTVVIRAKSSKEGITQREASSAPQTQDAPVAITSKRRMMMLAGCTCCSSILAAAQQSAAQANEGYTFTYGEETGALSWGGTCQTGTQQSPIDLSRKAAAGSCAGQEALTFQYNTRNNVRVKNTGTTIQVNFEPGNTVSWRDQQLELLQYHFHTPSEHAVNGHRTAMEAHLVHRNKATGGFVVLGVLLQPPEDKASQPNPCLAAALANVPSQPQTEAACPTTVNPLQLLPSGAAAKQFVHYTGSLTTPPCSEQVEWLVWQQPLPVTEKQVLDFMLFAGDGATYGHNSRPLQPLNGRNLEYNCLSVA